MRRNEDDVSVKCPHCGKKLDMMNVQGHYNAICKYCHGHFVFVGTLNYDKDPKNYVPQFYIELTRGR